MLSPPVNRATGVDSEEELHLACGSRREHFRTRTDLHRHLRDEKHQVIHDHDDHPELCESSDDDHDTVHNLARITDSTDPQRHDMPLWLPVCRQLQQ